MSFFILIIYFFLSSFQLISTGFVIDNYFFKKNYSDHKIFKYGIIGLFFLGFISLVINFFFPLSKIINNIIFLIPTLIFIYLIFKSTINFYKLLKIILLISIICSLIIFLENPYTPDAGLYHLPYIRLLNDSKIIIGLTNLNFTLGQSSFFQYISSTYNNSLFLEHGINMPLAQIFSLTFLNLVFFLKKNKKYSPINLIIFLILLFISIRISRYSEFGNDGPAHLLYLLLLCEILILIKDNKFSEYNFYYVSLISIFIFATKPTLGLSFFLILYLIFKFKFYNFYKLKVFYFFVFFLGIFFLKNILISGCVLFPIKKSCIPKLSWYSENITSHSNAERVHDQGEGWTKGYPDQPFPQKSFKEYNEGFYWIKIWSKSHGLVILNKLTPIVICFIIIFFILIGKNKKEKHIIKKLPILRHIYFLILFNLLFSIIWFLYFPVLRYGLGYIGFFLILSAFILFNKYDMSEKKNGYLKVLIIIVFSAIILKNLLRISENINKDYNSYPWPKIYSDTLKNNTPDDQIKIFKDDIFYFYKPNKSDLCFYNLSPCSHFNHTTIKNNISLEHKYGYKIFSIIE